MSQEKTVFIFHLTFAPDKVAYVKETFIEPLFKALAQDTKVQTLNVFDNINKPGSIMLVETWALGPKDLLEHSQKQPWFEKYITATEPFFTEPRRVEVFKEAEGFCYHCGV